MVTEHSIYTKYVSARQARAVARALARAGYAITIAQVRELGYAKNIGDYLEPADIAARERVYEVICQAAGFKPTSH